MDYNPDCPAWGNLTWPKVGEFDLANGAVFEMDGWEKFIRSKAIKNLNKGPDEKITEDEKKEINKAVKDFFADAKNSFEKLIESWKFPHSTEKKPPPHIFAYGKYSDSKESTELKNAIAALEKIKSSMASPQVLSDFEVVREWIRKNSTESKHFGNFEILGKYYWGTWCNVGNKVSKVPTGAGLAISELKTIGWSFENFKLYVDSVIAAKRGKNGDADCDGGAKDDRAIWDFGTILGVTSDGRVVSFSVYDFAIATAILQEKNANKPTLASQTTTPK